MNYGMCVGFVESLIEDPLRDFRQHSDASLIRVEKEFEYHTFIYKMINSFVKCPAILESINFRVPRVEPDQETSFGRIPTANSYNVVFHLDEFEFGQLFLNNNGNVVPTSTLFQNKLTLKDTTRIQFFLLQLHTEY